MMQFEAKVRRCGNSLWVVIPKEIVRKEKIRIGKKIRFAVLRDTNDIIKDLFGTLPKNKLSAQKFKNMAREGWED